MLPRFSAIPMCIIGRRCTGYHDCGQCRYAYAGCRDQKAKELRGNIPMDFRNQENQANNKMLP